MIPRSPAAALLAAAFLFCGSVSVAADLKPWSGPTPALVLKDLEGATHKLEAYRGKVVILNFWATWCEPCREEMPSLNRLRKSLEGKPVVMLAINYGENAAKIVPFLTKVPIDFPVLVDSDTQAGKAWKVRVMPATFIIGTDGRVRYSFAGERDWSEPATRDKILALIGESGAASPGR